MNNQQLQDAIDKARVWLAPQIDYKTTPSSDLKDATIAHIKLLQRIQAARAELAITPRTTLKDIK